MRSLPTRESYMEMRDSPESGESCIYRVASNKHHTGPMLAECRACDAGPTLKQLWAITSCWLCGGIQSLDESWRLSQPTMGTYIVVKKWTDDMSLLQAD